MAEQKNKKVEEQIDNTPIDGQIEIAPEDTAELKVVDETADTVKLEMPNGEQVDVDKESLDDFKKHIREQRGIDEDATINTSITPECGGIIGIDINDYVLKSNVLNAINDTMAKYEGKVVLAMSEVRDIIKAITTAVNE
jgi:hypothetical protein